MFLFLFGRQSIQNRFSFVCCNSCSFFRTFKRNSGNEGQRTQKKRLKGTGIRNPDEEVVEDDHQKIEREFRTTAEYLYPESVGNRKFQSKFRTRMEATMMKQYGLMDELIKPTGFSIVELRFSGDKSHAYILWDCYDDKRQEAEDKLYKWRIPLRNLIFQRLGMKRMPILKFVHDSLREEEQQTLSVLDQIQQEREEHESQRRDLMSKSMEEIARERKQKAG